MALRMLYLIFIRLLGLLGVERGFLLPGGGGERVEFLPRRFPVSLRLVDPLGDDGGVGSGFEGGLVAGESAFAVLDRLACLSLLTSSRSWPWRPMGDYRPYPLAPSSRTRSGVP
ncbi:MULTISPECIES: hypothetical protein [Streptomyces]|uniref:Secreted protein n=1 Tax=Streptomyces dengpaensis TaxID=2049881 RepID=A0ABN5HWA2_9ACTN|nr:MULTISPECIES: hypothetical protein [Streptomyces]AVH55392.1 hypothetical protein C4B68_05910 [Streptomyces dengpaensis]PIB07040.1 hypothetical protein B1C81_22060 [Streptomyces sp. HG99]